MAQNVSAVSVLKPGTEGVIFYAPLGTSVPTDAKAPLGQAFKNGGYISSEGVERGDGYEEGEGKQAFGGDTVVFGSSSIKPTLKVQILQTSDPEALALAYHEDDIEATGVNDLTLHTTSKNPTDKVLVLEFARSETVVERTVIYHARFASREDRKNDNETEDRLGVTYNQLPVGGKYATTYIAEV